MNSRCHRLPRGQSWVAVMAIAGIATSPVRSQGLQPPDGPWSGQAQCVLSASQSGYQYEQTHTWRITGGPPQISGAFRQWPAEWTVSGSGSRTVPSPLPAGGLGLGPIDSWTTTVPATFAPISIWEPPGSGRIRFGSQHGLLVARSGLVGSTSAGGTPQSFVSDLQEYPFPVIEESRTSTQVSGTRTRTIPGGGYRQPFTSLSTETCTWNFVKGAPAQTTAASGGRSDANLAGTRPDLSTRAPTSAAPATPSPTAPVQQLPAAPATMPPVAAVPPPTTATPAVSADPPAAAPANPQPTAPVTRPGREIFAGVTPPPRGLVPSETPATPVQPPAVGGRAGAPTPPRLPIDALPASTPPQPASSPPASGRYRVVITGIWCANPTSDDPLDRDGKGDEIYALTAVRKYDRNTAQVLESTNRGTVTYGDGHQAGSVQAGTQTVRGGIRAGDAVPDGASPDRRAPPTASRLPMLVWEGTLTDQADAVLVSFSVWESDEKREHSTRWSITQQASNDSLFITAKVQNQIESKGYFPLVLGAGDGIANRFVTIGNNLVGGALQVALGGFPIQMFMNNSTDRPIGVIASNLVDGGGTALPNQAVVFTREIIEAALARPSAPAPPFVIAPAAKPGILFLTFADSNGNSPASFADGRLAVYVLAVQVERF